MDEVIDQEGASQELAEELGEYGKSLKNKQIGEKNSVMDVVQNLQLSLNGFAERANKKGLSDIYKERISKNFGALKEYLNLLRNYKKFENAELSDEDGFLGRKLNERKETEELRTNKIKYVEESKKFLESEAAERKAA